MENQSADSNRYTKGLAAFISGLRWNAIPPEVIQRIKLLILDGLGCGICGSSAEHSRILIGMLSKIDSTTACSVWGTRQRLSPPHAALANGSMIQAFELDDNHAMGAVHISSGALPALVAVAESSPGMDGQTFLTAAVAAFEVAPRVGMCMGSEFATQGWHSGALAVFPAAAAAARAMGLSEEQTVHTLGIAGTQASGLMAAQYGSMVKRMHAGRGAQSGLYAALLAEAGYTGISNLFESEYGGFCTTFSRSTDRFDMAALTKGLGTDFETMRVSLKFYSCAASIHTSLDAVRKLQEQRRFSAGDIERIIVRASDFTVKHVGWKYEPKGLTAAQMNMRFCIATLLLAGDVSLDQFKPGAEKDPERIAIIDRIDVVEDPEISSRGRNSKREVDVEVRFKDGSRLSQRVTAARGSDKMFATESDIVDKFKTLASLALPSEQVKGIIETVLHLDQLNDISKLTKSLVAHSA